MKKKIIGSFLSALLLFNLTACANNSTGSETVSDDLPDMFFLNPYSQVQQFAENNRILDLNDQDFNSKIYDSVKKHVVIMKKLMLTPCI